MTQSCPSIKKIVCGFRATVPHHIPFNMLCVSDGSVTPSEERETLICAVRGATNICMGSSSIIVSRSEQDYHRHCVNDIRDTLSCLLQMLGVVLGV